jgi:hypothetical protein
VIRRYVIAGEILEIAAAGYLIAVGERHLAVFTNTAVSAITFDKICACLGSYFWQGKAPLSTNEKSVVF